MLSVYTRHYPPCNKTDSNYRRCRCPKWINGTLANSKFIRVSAQARSWEQAERKARLMDIAADPLQKAVLEPNCRITIEEAVKAFLADEQARKLANTSTCQSKTLLEKQLLEWARCQSLKFLDELTTAKLREFRASWANGALTTQRKHHRLNGFFDFCIENDWLHKNPAKRMKPVQVSPEPTDYFTSSEFAKIVDATYVYGKWRGGRDFQYRQAPGTDSPNALVGFVYSRCSDTGAQQASWRSPVSVSPQDKSAGLRPSPTRGGENAACSSKRKPKIFLLERQWRSSYRQEGLAKILAAPIPKLEPQDRGRTAEALSSSHVPRHIRSGTVAGRRLTRSSFIAPGP
jgi:hypothetical protein